MDLFIQNYFQLLFWAFKKKKTHKTEVNHSIWHGDNGRNILMDGWMVTFQIPEWLWPLIFQEAKGLDHKATMLGDIFLLLPTYTMLLVLLNLYSYVWIKFASGVSHNIWGNEVLGGLEAPRVLFLVKCDTGQTRCCCLRSWSSHWKHTFDHSDSDLCNFCKVMYYCANRSKQIV